MNMLYQNSLPAACIHRKTKRTPPHGFASVKHSYIIHRIYSKNILVHNEGFPVLEYSLPSNFYKKFEHMNLHHRGVVRIRDRKIRAAIHAKMTKICF